MNVTLASIQFNNMQEGDIVKFQVLRKMIDQQQTTHIFARS